MLGQTNSIIKRKKARNKIEAFQLEEHVPRVMGQNSLTPQGELNSLHVPPKGNNYLNFGLTHDQGVHLETLKTLSISGKQNSVSLEASH